MGKNQFGRSPMQPVRRKTGTSGAKEMRSAGSPARGRASKMTAKLGGMNKAQRNMASGHHAGNC